MQLRDNIPEIIYPGHWAFFGGHLELEEPPAAAVRRELAEEIGHVPSQLSLFKSYDDDHVIRHVFYAPLTVSIDALELNEGWDMGFFTLEDVHRGDRYSERAGKVCPLGALHQQILLDFWEHNRLLG